MTHCLWCDEPISAGVSWHEVFGFGKKDVLCASCRSGLENLAGALCRICGRSLDALAAAYREGDCCQDCVRWEQSAFASLLTKNRSLYQYNAFLKEIMVRYKFRGDVVMAEGFRREWRQLYQHTYQDKPVVPIPLSQQRLYERGFNQALVLAECLPAPCVQALERPVHEQKQSQKSRAARLSLNTGNFRLLPDSSTVKGEDVVLIDDIYTTGATLRQAAKVLLTGGAASVSALTLARG